jgi:hypothetical protein
MSLYILDGHAGAYKPSSPFELRHASTHRPLLVVVPERRLLAIHGAGPRRAADFRLATTLLRTVGEVIRAMVLRDRRAEPVRSVLEGTWPIQPGLTVDEIVVVLSSQTPRWRQMLELPHNATDAVAVEAIEEARRKGGRDTPLVRPIHLIEGPAMQILRLGTDDEVSSIRKLYASVAESGFRASGALHELVIADPNAVGQARARSILRVPVAYE